MHPTGSSDTILYLPSEIQRIKANTKLIAFIFHLTGLPQLTHEAGVQSWDKCLSILFIHIFLRHNSRDRHTAVFSVVTQRKFFEKRLCSRQFQVIDVNRPVCHAFNTRVGPYHMQKNTKRSDPAIDPRAAYSALRAMFNISWVEKQALRCLIFVRLFPRPSRSARTSSV